MIDLKNIFSARAAISDQVIRTPLVHAARLSLQLGFDLYLKLENLQHTSSFKSRGALNKLLHLTDAQKECGVIACSAGNHAQGVAFHAARLGIPAVIVMPKGTPFNKVQRTEEFGAEVVLTGAAFDDTLAYAETRAAQDGLTFVHPFDDPLVAAGQGTLGLEIIEDQPDLDALIVPIGGGGLIAGVATAVKAQRPEMEVIGAQAELYASVGHAPVAGGATLAEGIAVKAPAPDNLAVIDALVNRVETASEREIEAAIFDFLSSEKLVAEGAAGAGLAVAMKLRESLAGKKVGLVLCGGNIDSRLLSTLILRGLIRDGRITRLRFEIDDTPGQLSDISRIIGEGGANVIEVIHQRMMQAVSLKRAELDVVIEARDAAHVDELMATLRTAGFAVEAVREV